MKSFCISVVRFFAHLSVLSLLGSPLIYIFFSFYEGKEGLNFVWAFYIGIGSFFLLAFLNFISETFKFELIVIEQPVSNKSIENDSSNNKPYFTPFNRSLVKYEKEEYTFVKEESGTFYKVTKLKCGNCNKEVHKDSKRWDKCPHCGTTWEGIS